MARDDERRARASEDPIVTGLPDAPGILAAMRMTEGLQRHLRGLADELLVKPFPGSTLTRAERELVATAVSAGNDCFYCMDSHGAFAGELLRREGATDADTHLTVLIASAFCMYNRMVDGLRAKTPPSADAYRGRAAEIAEHGYSSANVQTVPR